MHRAVLERLAERFSVRITALVLTTFECGRCADFTCAGWCYLLSIFKLWAVVGACLGCACCVMWSRPNSFSQTIQHLMRNLVLALDLQNLFSMALRSSQCAAVLARELPRRRRETRNSSQVRDILSWECDGFGLTSDMDAQQVFVLIQKPLSHTKHGRRRNITPKKVSRCNEIFHRYKIYWSSLHIQIISNLFASKKVIGCRLLRGHVAICGK